MSKFKHTPKPTPTAGEGAELRATIRDGVITSASLTNFFGDGTGSVTHQERVEWDDLPAAMQKCLSDFAKAQADAVAAEGYERDPHTRRKQEAEAAKAAKEAAKAKAEEAPAEDPVVPEVG